MDCRWRSSAMVRVSPVCNALGTSFWDGVAEEVDAELLNDRSRGKVGVADVVSKGRRAK